MFRRVGKFSSGQNRESARLGHDHWGDHSLVLSLQLTNTNFFKPKLITHTTCLICMNDEWGIGDDFIFLFLARFFFLFGVGVSLYLLSAYCIVLFSLGSKVFSILSCHNILILCLILSYLVLSYACFIISYLYFTPFAHYLITITITSITASQATKVIKVM